jgi:hypothetical protein
MAATRDRLRASSRQNTRTMTSGGSYSSVRGAGSAARARRAAGGGAPDDGAVARPRASSGRKRARSPSAARRPAAASSGPKPACATKQSAAAAFSEARAAWPFTSVHSAASDAAAAATARRCSRPPLQTAVLEPFYLTPTRRTVNRLGGEETCLYLS